MSQVTGKITNVRTAPDPDQHGNTVYYLDLDTPKGPLSGGRLAAKTFEPRVGEDIEVDVRQGQNGPLLKRVFADRQQNGGGNEGQIIGWAHTLAAFELAHQLSHDDVANRADAILAARQSSARTGPSSGPANDADSTGGQGADAPGQASSDEFPF